MATSDTKLVLNRHTRIGDLAGIVHRAVRRTTLPVAILLLLATAALYLGHRPGATAFAELAVGTFVILLTWRARGIGLPVLPLLALQNLLVYGRYFGLKDQEIKKRIPALLDFASLDLLRPRFAEIPATARAAHEATALR